VNNILQSPTKFKGVNQRKRARNKLSTPFCFRKWVHCHWLSNRIKSECL